jgi:quercetin dioxygenase-like cupin family protein
MKYTVLYPDPSGESHFKDVEFPFDSVNFAPPAPPVGLSDFMDVSKMVFFNIPAGWFGDWHPAPKKQFFCCLKGVAELVASDGETRRFGAGDVFLLEDTSGKGHTTRVIGSEAFVAAVVQLAVKP